MDFRVPIGIRFLAPFALVFFIASPAHAQRVPDEFIWFAGAGLFGRGVIGQNRSMPHYLHFQPCASLRRELWPRFRCKDPFDQAAVGDGTELNPAILPLKR